MRAVPRPRNNFDLLRLAFAATVALVHAHVLSRAADLAWIAAVLSSDVAVNGFFAISGFLITGSVDASRTLSRYAGKRVRRIYPAYIAVVALAALAGALLSELGPAAYLRSPELPRYLAANLSFLNFLQPTLPGVFASNPTDTAVNGALWSVRIEVLCYFGAPILWALCRRFPPWQVCGLAFAACLGLAAVCDAQYARTGSELWRLARVELPVQVACFVCGAAAWLHFDAFERHAHALLGAAVLCIAVRSVPFAGAAATALFPAALTVLVLYAAFVLPFAGNFARFGDLSYGVYVWHFPVIQLLVSRGVYAAHPLGALALTAALVLALALLSWHAVERPFLRRDSHYKRAARPTS